MSQVGGREKSVAGAGTACAKALGRLGCGVVWRVGGPTEGQRGWSAGSVGGNRCELGWRARCGADPEDLSDDGEEFGLCFKGDGSP